MKFRLKLIFSCLIIALLAGTCPLLADSGLSIETQVSASRVEVGGQIVLDLIVNNASGNISSPKVSGLDGFTAYSQGHSKEISIINGQTSSRSVFSYVLVANSVGKKTVGPFVVNVGGRDFKVAPVQVDVVTESAASSQSPIASPGPMTGPPPSASYVQSGSNPAAPSISDKDVFVRAWVDKEEVFVNEPVMLTYTFYTRLPATYKGFDKEPVTTGFWVEDFPPERTVKRQEKFLNGSRFVVADVRKLALFPNEAGVRTLEPGSLSADFEIQQNDPFDDFFSNNIFGSRRVFRSPFASQMVSKIIPVDPIKITVKNLPDEGKPKDFSGAVGDYLMEGSVDKNEVQAGDPVTYRIRVWGRGNINTLQMPSLTKLDDFKVYDASSSINISKDKLIVEGEKITETVIVPKKPGSFTIQPVLFSYFDPADKTYKVMKTEPQVLTVTGSPDTGDEKPTTTSADMDPAQKQTVAVLAKDIRFIKMIYNSIAVGGFDFYKKPVYWAVSGFLFLGWALFGFLGAARRTDGLAGLKDIKFRRSHAIARNKLRRAKQLLKVEKQDEFYAEAARAVYDYFGDKLGITAQAVSLPVIEARAGEELPSELYGEIKILFDELSSGRFALSKKSKEDMQDLYASADKVIASFERVKLK